MEVEKSKQLYDLKKKLKILKGYSGHGTELISVYISPRYPIAEISNKLRDEMGQSANIKSKTTRKNVQDALTKVLGYIKMFREPPPNGMAIFCGNISKEMGRQDIQLFSIVPHEPIPVQLYRCDSVFFLEPLENMLSAKDVYGLVVLDGREATVGLLEGKNIRVIRQLNSTAHAKHHKGGQSSRRFERIRVEKIEEYYKRIGGAMDPFVNIKELRGVIVGGPGPAKEDFLKMKTYNYQLKVLGMVDTGYTDEIGLREITDKMGDIIKEHEMTKEKEVYNDFVKRVVKNLPVTYGIKEVLGAVDQKRVETLLISEKFDWKQMKYVCISCKKEKVEIARDAKELKCECGGKLRLEASKDLIEILLDKAEVMKFDVEMISTDTSEGSQFYNGFGGIGAILRY